MSEDPKPIPYMERLMPWGETGRQAEARISKLGLRMLWTQQFRLIRKETGIEVNDARYFALLNYPPNEFPLPERKSISAGDAEFLERCREGFAMNLRSRASIDNEMNWIATNMFKDYPDIERAPCYSAISWLMAIRQDDRIRADFWRTYQAKRMAPGDAAGKKKKSMAFKEDAEDTEADEGAARDAEAYARLFGDSTD